jgi:hypothetical protein
MQSLIPLPQITHSYVENFINVDNNFINDISWMKKMNFPKLISFKLISFKLISFDLEFNKIKINSLACILTGDKGYR